MVLLFMTNTFIFLDASVKTEKDSEDKLLKGLSITDILKNRMRHGVWLYGFLLDELLFYHTANPLQKRKIIMTAQLTVSYFLLCLVLSSLLFSIY